LIEHLIFYWCYCCSYKLVHLLMESDVYSLSLYLILMHDMAFGMFRRC
jgi:hypothetical protein